MAAEKEAETAAKGGGNKKLIIIFGAIIVVLLGALVMVISSKGGDATETQAEEEEEDEEEEEESVATVYSQLQLDDPFIVNLSTGARYLRTKLTIEYDKGVFDKIEKKEAKRIEKEKAKAAKSKKKAEEEAQGGEEGEKKEGEVAAEAPTLPGVFGRRYPMIKDSIINLLSSKKVIDLTSSDGKTALKAELITKINESLATEDPVVTNVYFTDFLIQ